MERLRDRTDELELIISSLTIFALFSLPGWLFNAFADSYTHLSTSFAIAGSVVTMLLTGFCYGLAACFVVHLMARAYWVGLIGLRSAFPEGIRWARTKTLGPLSREHYRKSLPSLETNIESTDRLASSLFAVISMLTLSGLWFGTIMVATLTAAGAVGAQFGLTNAALLGGSLLMLAVFVGVPLLVYLLDAQLAARATRLRTSRSFSAMVGGLRRIASLAYPQRLVLPVQLTLQSNTRPVAFFIALVLGIFVILSVGSYRVAAWRDFTISSEFTYLDSEKLRGGFRSVFYEDMPSGMNRLRAWPRVPSFRQSGSHVRLFLPYHPLRDNLVLDQLCTTAPPPTDAAVCLRKLWSVSIAGTEIALDSFIVAERSELAMRGLIGLLPLSGLEPGLHQIDVVWNPNSSQTAAPLDDRYAEVTSTYTIPFAFMPDFELGAP